MGALDLVSWLHLHLGMVTGHGLLEVSDLAGVAAGGLPTVWGYGHVLAVLWLVAVRALATSGPQDHDQHRLGTLLVVQSILVLVVPGTPYCPSTLYGNRVSGMPQCHSSSWDSISIKFSGIGINRCGHTLPGVRVSFLVGLG